MLKSPVQPKSDRNRLDEFNKLWLAGSKLDMKLSGVLIHNRYKIVQEINEFEGVAELFDEIEELSEHNVSELLNNPNCV